MIEINIIREKYASMPDSELLAFAQSEGQHLTEEGHNLLNTELLRRKLVVNIAENTEQDKSSANNFDQYSSASWIYAFDQKENGKNDVEIVAGLIESGMEESSAMQLVSKMEEVAKQNLKKAEQEKLIGGAILASGIAITFLPLSMPANRLTYIIAWCTILLGALKFIKGLYYKSRFKKIIRAIAIENNF